MKAKKWLLSEQSRLLKHVGELLERGYTLSEAIDSISYQMGEEKKNQLRLSMNLLKEGFSFSVVLQRLEFHQTLVSYVYFAEQHGGQAHAFIEASNYIQKQEKDKKDLVKVLTYPAILVIMTILLFVFVDQYLLPRFVSLFQTMSLRSNVFTEIIMLIGSSLPVVIALLISLLIILLLYYLLIFRKFSAIKQKTLLVSIPLFGPFYQLLLTHYFAVQMSYLLGGGLSISEAISLFEGNKKSEFDQELGILLKHNLLNGKNLEDIMRSIPLFDSYLATIIQHGQKNGRLDQELHFFSTYCMNRFQDKVVQFMKYIQPTIYILVGILIVSMYLSILLPMFHLMDGI